MSNVMKAFYATTQTISTVVKLKGLTNLEWIEQQPFCDSTLLSVALMAFICFTTIKYV